MIPQYWKAFVNDNALEYREIEIPEDVDLTGAGAEIEILDEEGIRQETEDLYSGIAVSKDGFVPVGSCQIGTGDPYFIYQNDGPKGPLYRIYHDMVGEDGYEREEATDIVLPDYTEILNYIITGS
ncbi:hypothetical protein ACFL27_09145 [candidate division CSSED10-310 bacterium]|uniref:SMI1/KNR4 family protein n=1 Tax=candidate division CSSED10-310 bacterium TaxID=2855610 RepID=A0ABV6YVV5_UNCC1